MIFNVEERGKNIYLKLPTESNWSIMYCSRDDCPWKLYVRTDEKLSSFVEEFVTLKEAYKAGYELE